MNKVTWKRKKTNITSSAASVFFNKDSEEEEDNEESSTCSNKKAKLENCVTQSKKLIQEAVQLAEATRYFFYDYRISLNAFDFNK